MLNRRFLRIKVMQMLYAFFHQDKPVAAAFEKDLVKSLDKIYELYLTILALIGDLHHVALVVMDENRHKHVPGQEDLNPNTRFVNNRVLHAITSDKKFKEQIEKRKISWQNDFDLVRKLFAEIRAGEDYKSYMASKEDSLQVDKAFVVNMIANHLSENEVLISFFEEKNIHWADDTFVAFNSVIRTIEESPYGFEMQSLLRDEKDDMQFVSTLFNKTILYKTQLDEIISRHTQNWELERIADMDVLLMEMAITEVMHLENIPVKASLNEYIDISKEYSSPSSKNFINGILDKVIAELKSEGKVSKSGRGLRED